MKKIILGVGCLVLGVVIGLIIWKKEDFTLLSPIGKWSEKSIFDKKKDVIGFLPTWMVGKTKLYGGELSQMIFLGIEVESDGSLVWDVQSKKINNKEFVKLKESIARYGGKNILGIKLFEDKKIDTLIGNPEARKRLVNEVKTVVDSNKFKGVNIDFEYMSDATRMLDEDFLEFLVELRQAEWGEISVDVFANTIIKGDGESLRKLLERVDKVIIMAYDFHRPGSDFAGPVAPMEAEVGERSIGEILGKMVEYNLDKEKMIMAYPLYGYEWETNDNTLGSMTRDVGYGRTVFYSEGVGITGTQWDEMSQSPWASWTEKAQRSKIVRKKVGKVYKRVTEYYMVDQWHQAYFENKLSLEIKVAAAKRNNLGGVAFWALGYEGKDSNLIYDLRNMIYE